jgi:tetratricopeptide (TPR) repeat protein
MGVNAFIAKYPLFLVLILLFFIYRFRNYIKKELSKTCNGLKWSLFFVEIIVVITMVFMILMYFIRGYALEKQFKSSLKQNYQETICYAKMIRWFDLGIRGIHNYTCSYSHFLEAKSHYHLHHYKKTIELFETTSPMNTIKKFISYNYLSKSYEALGDYDQALHYAKKTIDYKRSHFKEQRGNRVLAMELDALDRYFRLSVLLNEPDIKIEQKYIKIYKIYRHTIQTERTLNALIYKKDFTQDLYYWEKYYKYDEKTDIPLYYNPWIPNPKKEEAIKKAKMLMINTLSPVEKKKRVEKRNHDK